jgi:hypothetical protein
VGFDLLWADDRNAALEPPQYFRVIDAGMAMIRDELEAQGAGNWDEGEVHNHPIDLNKLAVNDGQIVTDAECAAILRVVSAAPKTTPEIEVEHERVDDLEAWRVHERVDDLEAWRELWNAFSATSGAQRLIEASTCSSRRVSVEP